MIKYIGLNILVDPGANRKKLLEALEKDGLRPEYIDMVFLTHYHLDHILNIRSFLTRISMMVKQLTVMIK